MQTTLQQLIDNQTLVRDDESERLEDDGFISYSVTDDVVLLTESQSSNGPVRINYVQLISDEEGLSWVVQLEASPDMPNNYPHSGEIDVKLFRLEG